jgi:hypothetical protein
LCAPLWRDWTDEVLAGFHLNERQLQTIAYLKSTGVIIKNGKWIDLHSHAEQRRGWSSPPCGCVVTRDSDRGDSEWAERVLLAKHIEN